MVNGCNSYIGIGTCIYTVSKNRGVPGSVSIVDYFALKYIMYVHTNAKYIHMYSLLPQYMTTQCTYMYV
jgi:hypothetical protein